MEWLILAGNRDIADFRVEAVLGSSRARNVVGDPEISGLEE